MRELSTNMWHGNLTDAEKIDRMHSMRSGFKTLFRYFLLLCVMLNLGDAPYIDEIFAETNLPVNVSIADSQQGAQADPQNAEHPVLAQHSVYENLLANVPLPTREINLALQQTSQETPPASAFYLPSPPCSRLERPPRQTQIA